MPGTVVPRSGRRCCCCYGCGSQPSLTWLMLLLLPGSTIGLWFALASGSIEPEGRVGVDLISPGPKSDDPSADVINRRLSALERRFVRSAQFAYEPLVVFFQLRDVASGSAANSDDDDILTMALELFASQRQRSCIIFRFSPDLDSDAVPDAMVSSIGSFGSVVLVLFLLPDLANSNQPLLTQISRAFPLAMKLIFLTSNGYSRCPDEAEVAAARTALWNLWSKERVQSAVIVWYRCPESSGMAIAHFDPFSQKGTSDGSLNELTCDEPPSEGRFHIATDLNQSLSNDPTVPAHRLNLNRAPLDVYGFEAAMAYRRRDIDTMPRTFPPCDARGTSQVCNLTSTASSNSSQAGDGNYMDGLFGADIEALRELATRMNFTPRVHYTRANFGHRTANGSFTGVLGHLVTTRDSWFSMNVYFLKDYETRDVQFSAAVYQDRLCVFVKAAGMPPAFSDIPALPSAPPLEARKLPPERKKDEVSKRSFSKSHCIHPPIDHTGCKMENKRTLEPYRTVRLPFRFRHFRFECPEPQGPPETHPFSRLARVLAAPGFC
ncbi:AGAP000293-PA-like protein [Anopheles sinensis]|uniref:AGAP000293-PA-like protein n=1 Tax=Anopheles sinensis TaxID=74873 RepID=A0A084WPN2_ANOSI|nr:AGAP000293-PA-like protein [Anopheles sinensis]